MEFLDVVKERYSCRKFSNQKIGREKLQEILEVGQLAPTAKNNQEQHIYVVESQEGLKKIDSLTPCRYGAPTVLIVAFDKNNTFTYPGQKYDSGIEDASIVATHLILAAKNAGIDSCWVNYFDPDKAKALFNLQPNEEILTFIDLGFAADGTGPLANHTNRKSISETTSYI